MYRRMAMGTTYHPTYLRRRIKGKVGSLFNSHKVRSPWVVWGFKREKIIRISQRGGGQEIPIFPSLSAKCTVLDYSSKQCESKKKSGRKGRLWCWSYLSGYDIGIHYIFDDKEEKLGYALPFNPLNDKEVYEYCKRINEDFSFPIH